MPVTVMQLLHGAVAPVFVKEVVSACREVGGGAVDAITEMLVLVAFASKDFSRLLLQEILEQYKSVNPSELKHLSQLLLDLMVRTTVLFFCYRKASKHLCFSFCKTPCSPTASSS